MPYITLGREVVRGTISRDHWRADVTLMCSDRFPAGAAARLFVEIRWRARRDEGDVPGLPEDAKPIVLTLRKRTAAATGDVRFDARDGATTRGFVGDTRALLTLFAQAPTSGAEPDVVLEVRIEGDVAGSVPLSVDGGAAAPATAVVLHDDTGAAPAHDIVLHEATVALRAAAAPVAPGAFRWVSVRPDALPLSGGPEGERVEVRGALVSDAVGDAPVCVLFTPRDGGPAVMAVHAVTVAETRVLLGDSGEVPAPDLIGVGAGETFRAVTRPPALAQAVSWRFAAGAERTRVAGRSDLAAARIEGVRASAAMHDVQAVATIATGHVPASLAVTHDLTVTSVVVVRADGSGLPAFVNLGETVPVLARVTPDALARDVAWAVVPGLGSAARARVQPVAGADRARSAELAPAASSAIDARDDIRLTAGLAGADGATVASTVVSHPFTVTLVRPLHLAVPPADLATWTLQQAYGPGTAGAAFHDRALLRTTGAGRVIAAADGTLSTHPPGVGVAAPPDPATPAGPPPPAVTLYLHLAPAIRDRATGFHARAAGLNGVAGFVYDHLETASLEAALGDLLDRAEGPVAGLGRAERVALLVAGQATVPVTGGHALGAASPDGAPAGRRDLGLGVLADDGAIDPAFAYDWMRDFVADGQPAVDAFLALVPRGWPVIDPTLTVDHAIDLTGDALYPMAVLADLRRRYALTTAQWRTVGDNQKALWRRRLLRRAGFAPAGDTAPPFEFDDRDWQNLFQLEALVEFYVNFDDPHRPPPLVAGENEPRPPLEADGVTPTPGYRAIDLTGGWHIVVVDAFGGRLAGAAATVAGSVVTLDGAPDLRRVNPGFDTIYLPGDHERPGATYRVAAANHAASTVTVDGAPDFAGGTSAWHLPAGVSGELPALAYNLGPGGARGFDHYDAALFVVKDGAVHAKFRWSSYTSRNYAAGSQLLSSLRGNRQYDFASFRSNSAFINYAFSVVDHGAAYDGVREARFYFATPVTADAAAPGANPNGGGKTLIRIHNGNHGNLAPGAAAAGGTGSAGCIVSPSFYDFRDVMITLFQADRVAAAGAPDPHVAQLQGAGSVASGALLAANTVTAAQWNNRLTGSFWAIRPDERPLG